ncbi:hypothetical protein NBRC116188_19840 [Oceaniserpentilla sp. 4NH20-0058]|uniref:transporter substrate-binding domain-containing protein n=1 Tax=Oceaniserpentilla sp. 4NH20-0058 TaxID=3127660 RepID=UPI0031092BE4
MKQLWQTLFILVLALFVAGIAHGQNFDAMVFGVPNFKPYTYRENGEIKGEAIEKITTVLAQLPVTYKLRLYDNYTLLIKALKRDEIQGFFLATKNPERDKYAVFSKPIDFNNWAWFTLANTSNNVHESDFKLSAIVGTVKNTNTYRWLVRHGYRTQGHSRNEIPNLLLQQSIHAGFLAEKVFEDTCIEQGINPTRFNKRIEKKREFSIYVSKHYLNENADFINQLNQHIPDL